MRNLRVKAQSESGFTLVELLVVMLILAILAAIAIPSFFNQRDKAKDSDAKADARSAQTAMETFATDNNGSYAGVLVADLQAIESTLTGANLAIPASTVDSYSITSTQADTGNVFTVARAADGSVTYTCTTAGTAGCPSSGIWSN